MYFVRYIKEYDYKLRIVLMGKEEIGKTFFKKRIELYKDYKKFNHLHKYYIATFGLDDILLLIKFNDKLYKFYICDPDGHERSEHNYKICCKNADVILIFYDALDKSSFEKAKILIKDCLNDNKKLICFLIRSKYDLNLNSEKNEIVSDEEALEFADKNNLIFTHISSFEKYGNGIDN